MKLLPTLIMKKACHNDLHCKIYCPVNNKLKNVFIYVKSKAAKSKGSEGG